MNDEQRQTLLGIASGMTAADLSVLRAALQELSPDRPTLLTTTPGSNNDRLWSEMVALGWMSSAEPLDAPVPSKVYAVNLSAKDAIADFLANEARRALMPGVINELRGRIAPMIIEAVRGVDGTPADLAIALASVVEGTMRRAIKPELYDEFLHEVAKVAEALRRR